MRFAQLVFDSPQMCRSFSVWDIRRVLTVGVRHSPPRAEIMHMSENGLCKDGEQEALIQAGETAIGGRLPINTDGGLLALAGCRIPQPLDHEVRASQFQ